MVSSILTDQHFNLNIGQGPAIIIDNAALVRLTGLYVRARQQLFQGCGICGHGALQLLKRGMPVMPAR